MKKITTLEKQVLLSYVYYFMDGPFGKKETMSDALVCSIKKLYSERSYNGCVREIISLFDINCIIDLGLAPSMNNPEYAFREKIMQDIMNSGISIDLKHFFTLANVRPKEQKYPAIIFVNDSVPMINTSAFKETKIKMIIQRWLFITPPETFISVVSHELAHLLLYATRNPFRKNESATDILAMIMSGPDIIKLGRKANNTTFGYLDDEAFDFVYHAIKSRLKGWSISKIKSQAINAFNNF